MSNHSKSLFGSLITAMVTPFKKNGMIDFQESANLAIRLVKNGNDGLVIAGTTGEGSSLTIDEKERLFKTIVNAVDGKAKIIAGSGTNNTEQSIQLSKKAEQAGVDGLLLVTPYYVRPTQDGILNHFISIANTVNLPIMLYNIPQRSATNIELKTLVRLSKHKNIVAIKESKNNFIDSVRAMDKTNLLFYSGDDTLLLPWLTLGAVGIVGVTSHIFTQYFRKIIDLTLNEQLNKARLLNFKIDPIIRAVMKRVPGAVAIKYIMNIKGLINNPYVRLPLVYPNYIEKKKIDRDLREVELDFS